MGRSCQADSQLPGGGEPPPYGCVVGIGCVGAGLPIKSQLPGLCHDPALRVHGRGRVRWDRAAKQICRCPGGS